MDRVFQEIYRGHDLPCNCPVSGNLTFRPVLCCSNCCSTAVIQHELNFQLPFLLARLSDPLLQQFDPAINAALNTSNYTAFESLLLTEKNLIALENVFYPTNLHSSMLVGIYYHLELGPATVSDSDKTDTNLVQVQSLPKDKGE